MDRRLAAILFISLALNLFSASIPVVRGWDETVYAGLGWNLKTNGRGSNCRDKTESAGTRPAL